MSVVTSLVRPVVRPISSNLILPSRSQAFPSSGFLEAGYASPSQSLDGLIYGQEPFSGTQRAESVGRWYEFDGTDDYVVSNLVITGEATLALWVWMDTAPSVDYRFICSRDATNTKGVDLHVESDGDLKFFDANATYASTRPLAFDSKWHHVAVTLGSSGVQFFIDGVDAGSDDTYDNSVVASDVDLYFGRFATSAIRHFLGRMKNAAIYSRVLSTTEIRRLVTHPTEIDETDLELFYDGEDTHPTKSYDRSGNGNHGTKTNITASTFHGTSTVQNDCRFSHQNKVGYSPYTYTTATSNSWTSVGAILDNDAYSGDFDITVVSTSTSSSGNQSFGFHEGDSLPSGFYYENLDFMIRRANASTVQVSLGGVDSDYSIAWAQYEKFRIRRVGTTIEFYVDDTLVQSETSSATLRPIYYSLSESTPWLVNKTVTALEIGANASLQPAYIPRDESDKTKDVFGSTLGFSGAAPANAQLKKSGCATFNGTTSYADGDTAAITGYPFTMMARVKPTSGSLGTVCAVTDRDNSSYYYGFGYDNGDRVYIVFRNSVVQSHTEDIELDEGDAHLTVVFVSETRAKFYRNGILLLDKSDFTSSSFWAGIDSYVVGCTRISSPTSFYDGAVWDFRLYDGEKTASEILAISQGQSDYDQTDLAVGLPMEEGAGSKHYDVSPNGSHADITALTESVHYGDTQDSHHYSRTKGHSRHENHDPGSEIENGWAGAGTSPPTTAFGTYEGKQAKQATFSTSITDTGYSGSRADCASGSRFSCTSGEQWTLRYKVRASRELTSGEAWTIYYTGAAAVGSFNMTSATVAGISSDWIDIEVDGPTNVTGTNFLVLFKNFSGAPSSDITFYVAEHQVVEQSGADEVDYTPTTGTAITSRVSVPALADGSADAIAATIQHAAGSFFNNYPGGEVDTNPNIAPKRNNAVIDNLCPDDEFGSGWGPAGSVVANEGYGEGPDGRYNAVQITNVNDAGGERFTENANGTEFNGAKTWTFSCYMKGEGSNVGKLAYIFINRLAGTSGPFNTAEITLTGEWQRIEVTQTMLSDTVGLKFGPYCGVADSTNASEVLIAMPKLEEWHEATPFIESDRASEDLPHDWEMPVELVEGQLLLDDATYWGTASLTSVTGGQSDPDGGTDAFSLLGNGGSSPRIQSANAITSKANEWYKLTVHMKEGTADGPRVSVYNNAVSSNIMTMQFTWSGGVPVMSSTVGTLFWYITDAGSGWNKLEIWFQNNAETTAKVLLYADSGNDADSTLYYKPRLNRTYLNPLFFREITKNGNLHRVDRLAFYNTVLTGARVDAVEQYTAETTV